jgi:hypothetical protein
MSAEPDVEIVVTVRAEELRFDCEPETSVRVYSDPPGWEERTSARHNLPDQIEPGVTYKDIEVAWRVAARLGDPDV